VSVRRTKDQVGIGMPFTHDPFIVDVDMKIFKDAHAEVTEKIVAWLDEFMEDAGRQPADEEIETWAAENIGLISILRRAAGLTKIPAAIELITEHVRATTEYAADGSPVYTRPLIVWTHHRDVTEAMATALGGAIEDAAMIIGGLSTKKKDAVVDAFQRGEIPVIACSIIAAGVGIDLTRSADVIFVETDWTPGNVQQALDRVQGVNQKRNVSALTLIATGTLDERIQKVQNAKGKTLGAILGGDHDVSVAENIEDLRSASEIVGDLVRTALAKKRSGGARKKTL
jgi:ERCC4-related helicase